MTPVSNANEIKYKIKDPQVHKMPVLRLQIKIRLKFIQFSAARARSRHNDVTARALGYARLIEPLFNFSPNVFIKRATNSAHLQEDPPCTRM